MKMILNIIKDVTVMTQCPRSSKNNDIAVCASYGPQSYRSVTYICLIVNIQVFLLELVGLFLGLTLSLHVNGLRVRIRTGEVHGLSLSCVFILTMLSFA